jgi:hypothetical protein
MQSRKKSTARIEPDAAHANAYARNRTRYITTARAVWRAHRWSNHIGSLRGEGLTMPLKNH